MKLPDDIKKYVNKKMTKSVLLFLFFLLTAAFVLYAATPTLSEHFGTIPIVLLCVGVLILAAYFSKILSFLFDRDWKGRILDVKVETKTGSYSHYGKTALCEKNTILLMIEKENGKVIPVRTETFVSKSEDGENVRIGMEYKYAELVLRGKPETFLRKYHKGDTVYHFRGFKRNLYVSNENDALTDCVVCGTENDAKKERCFHCGHSLIKP